MRTIIFTLLLFFSLFGLSQNVAIELTEMNLVYKGIKNPIKIVAERKNNQDLIVKTSPFLAYEDGNITADKRAPSNGHLYVGTRENLDTIWSDTISLRIRSLPQPTAQLGGLPNDGLPKGKAAVISQTQVLATMGVGFAYNMKYDIHSYKFIIIYRDKPPVMFSGNSNDLTGQIRRALRTINPGDRILIEGIKAKEKTYGFKANLRPIIIEVRGSKLNTTSSIYGRIQNQNSTSKILITNPEDLAHTLDTFKDGKIDIFYTGPLGNFRISSLYENGIETKRNKYDDYNVRISSQVRMDTNSWEYTAYFKNGLPKVKTFYTEGEVLVGTNSFSDCYNQRQLKSVGIFTSDTCILDSNLSDIFDLFLKEGIAASGSFKSYYTNGQLKLEGNLILKKGMPIDSNLSWCGTGISYYTYRNSTLLNGEWKFYSNTGKTLEIRKYYRGKLVRPRKEE